MEKVYAVRLDGDIQKLKAIKTYRAITGASLEESMRIIDNTPGVIFDFISLDEANDIVAKFQAEDCNASVSLSSTQVFFENDSIIETQSYNGADPSTASGKELLIVLKRIKNTIFQAQKLQDEMEAADATVEKVENEKFQRETHMGPITFIGAIIGGLLGFVILSIIGAIIGLIIGLFVANSIDSKKNGKKYLAQAQKYYDENYPVVKQKRDKIYDMVTAFFNSAALAEAQEVIPSDYLDVESIDYMIKIVENRRADTLKEAINMYEDYLYKCRIEEMQRQQVIAAKESAEAQKQTAQAAQQQVAASLETAKYARATARATKLNTFINIIKK